MSKSAAEQFQIKKKRKNHNNFKSSKRYATTTAASTVATTTKTTAVAAAAAARKQFLPLAAAQRNFKFNFKRNRTELPHIITRATHAATGYSNSCLRERTQLAAAVAIAAPHNVRMPLSQGFYAKGSLATKRALKAVEVCDAQSASDAAYVKRAKVAATSENYSYLLQREFSTIASRNASSVRATLLQQQLQLNGKGSNSSSSSGSSNNLQLSYLLGESLARYGHLQEAFNIYAIIASEHYGDSHIPLEQLSALATCVTNYVRQLGKSSSPEDATATVASFVPAASNNQRRFDHRLEANNIKTKHTKLHWQQYVVAAAAAAAATCVTSLPDAIVGEGGSLDLHAPTRELRPLVPSPVLSDDYDPLMCPLCRDILRCPVTTNCGHTFCRQCCETITQCNICHIKFPKTVVDDFVAESNFARHCVSESNVNSFHASAANASNYSSNASNALPTSAAISTTTTTAPPASALFYNAGSRRNELRSTPATTGHSSSPSSSNHFALRPSSSLRPVVVSPTTVTTTTVASTTATATTTMASTSSATAATTTTSSQSSLSSPSSLSSLATSSSSSSSSSTSSFAPAVASATSAVGGIGGGNGALSSDNMKFMPDVLVRRLVEKWWGHDLQAKKINETAASYMHLNLLDDALKFCNASLEKSPTNVKSLLLRSEVLRKLNHCQSSLADVDNALKYRYTSSKAHYLRALALSKLGRFDEALYNDCVAISLDKSINLTSSELFQHDLAKILQKLLAQTPKNKSTTTRSCGGLATSPYSVLAEHRLRRKQMALLSDANGDDHLSSFDVDVGEVEENFIASYGKHCDIMTDEEEVELDVGLMLGSVGAGGYVKQRAIAKDYELAAAALRRQTTRKHFRRKWMKKETELLPTPALLDEARSSALFRGILERTQQEVQRLIKLETSGESPHKQLVQVPSRLIDASDFDCVLCCRTFWKPVVTPCGHTYCWVCLDRCMDYTSSCPLCMSPLVEPNVNPMLQGSSSPIPFILAKRPVTKFLEAAMKRFIPDHYAKRFRQEIDMEPSVPVFICTTAFPFVPCPLFVYEQRYRLMVRRAVESGEKQFGIVQPHGGKSRYFDVGTILDIRDCVLLGDGCSILSTIGCKRFKILARNEKDGYETAKVEYIYDETIADENLKFVSNMHAAVLSKAIEWFESLSTELKQEILQSFGEMPPVEHNWYSIADGPAWAWWIIALLPLSQQLKVDILATTSLEKRLRAIEKTLDYMSGNYRRSQQDCSVVVVQQQHQQQQQQHQQCDDELTQMPCQTDECCQRSTTENQSQLML